MGHIDLYCVISDVVCRREEMDMEGGELSSKYCLT